MPQLAVGCFVFAIVGLFGTMLVANALQPYFKGKAAELARKAQEKERSKGN